MDDFRHCENCPCSWWSHRGPYSLDGAGCNGPIPEGECFSHALKPATGECDCPGYKPMVTPRAA